LENSNYIWLLFCFQFMPNKFKLIRKNIEKQIIINDDEFKFFSDFLIEKKIRKKDFFLREGEVCNYTGFINHGCLRTFTRNHEGNENVTRFAIEDYWVGDLYSYLTGDISPYNIEATMDSTVLMIHKNDMEKVYEQVPKFERFFRIIVQRGYIALERRFSVDLSSSALQKYENLLQKFNDIELRVSQKHIASYLGITPESLSRIKKKTYNK
jgi:CRP-like cAMP-binding protein